MPRTRIHADIASKQAAYRERKRKEAEELQKLLGRVTDLCRKRGLPAGSIKELRISLEQLEKEKQL